MEDFEDMEFLFVSDDYRIFDQYQSRYRSNLLNFQGWHPGADEIDFRNEEIAYCKRQIKTYENAKSPKWRIMFSEELIPSDQEYETAQKIIEFLENKNREDNRPYESCETYFQKIYHEQLFALEALSNQDPGRTEKNLSVEEIDIFNEQNKIGIERYDRLYNYFLSIYRPEKLWKPIIDSLRKEAEEIIATQEFQLERKPSQNFNSFSEMVRNSPVDVIVLYMAKRKAWTDWIENSNKSGKTTSKAEQFDSKSDEPITSRFSEAVQAKFGFMTGVDVRKNRQRLTDEEYKRLVEYVTYYFETDFKLPPEIQPVRKFYTGKGNVLFTFTLLFEELHPNSYKPDSYIDLIKGCFIDFKNHDRKSIRKSWTREPQYYKQEILKAAKSPQTRNFPAK